VKVLALFNLLPLPALQDLSFAPPLLLDLLLLRPLRFVPMLGTCSLLTFRLGVLQGLLGVVLKGMLLLGLVHMLLLGPGSRSSGCLSFIA
jgi:hypothetical protein